MIGMLSKAKGQVLRVAAALHVLSGDCEDDEGKIVMSDVSMLHMLQEGEKLKMKLIPFYQQVK